MRSLEPGGWAVVVGAGGGIGGALVAALARDADMAGVLALARRPAPAATGGRVRTGMIDVGEPASIEQAAARLADAGAPIRLVIVATGTLHDGQRQPEKSYRALDADALLESYRINAVGPALVARHMLPLLAPGGRSVFAALSARVGSIGDNRSGGWHGYRASKAALNMILRNLAIETRRRTPDLICVGLHPGTVETGLSRPFQRNVPGPRLFTPEFAAERLLAVIDGLRPEDSGSVLDWQGGDGAALKARAPPWTRQGPRPLEPI